ncbi:choice-of-anchor J domain-containing protein [candidate division KSB1 bacterium]|nr:choice-of-anchor J domain-containing protein [candidate division KSB1 bacterium]
MGGSIPANFHRLTGPSAAVPCPTELIDSNPEAIRLGFYDPPFTRLGIELGGQSYVALRMDGEGSTLLPGQPDLPMVNRVLMVSNHGQVGVRIVSQSYHVESLDALPAPFVSLQSNDEESRMLVTPDSRIYSTDAWYPAEVAAVSTPATFRDLRIVNLSVFPIQVNPVTREIRVYDQLEVAVENLGGIGEHEIDLVPQSITPGFKKLYSMVTNFRDSALDALPVVPGKQLFICPDGTTQATTQLLVDWRRKKGNDAYLTTATAIGGNDAVLIRNYIVTEYNNSGGTLESVCLVGDPSGGAGYNLATHGTQLDNFFGTLGTGPNPDPVPDIGVGRLPVLDATQLGAMVTKTVNYEADPYVADTTWFRRAWCAAHIATIESNASTKQYTRQIMLQHGMDSVYFNIMTSDMTAEIMAPRIDQGVCVFNHRMSWLFEMDPIEIDGLTNGRKLPFVMTVTCGTGTFSGSGDVLSEAWVRKGTASTPIGAIGAVGMSGSGTHVAQNNIVDAGVMHGIFSLGIREQSLALIAGKLALYQTYSGHDDASVNNFCYWANLMGDPGVELFTRVPRTAVVTHPASIPLNTNNVTVTVAVGGGSPDPGALVGLVKGTETFARGYTDENGIVNLAVSTPTTGTMIITVTGPGIDTYNGTITVASAAASLSFFSNTVDDDNSGGTVGNSNGVLNPGETIDLNLRLTNSGTTSTVTGISGTLSCSHPGVSVTGATRGYPNIAVGANAAPTTPFRIQTAQLFNAEPISFFLTTTSSAGTQVIRLDLTPSSGDVAFVSSSFPDGNSRVDPGDTGPLTVTINNSGAVAFTNASAILRSLDPDITVTDSLGTYGAVANGANATNSGNPFALVASAQALGGSTARMQLVLTDVTGFRDSVEFLQNVGLVATTCATGPDAYGYYAFDNTETSPASAACQYFWTEISGVGTNLGMTDNAQDQDQSALRTLPFTFRYYGVDYTQITICSNGWIAFGDHTDITDFRNYPIPGPLGPPAMVAAFWDDLVIGGIANPGVWIYHDVANAQYIVQWRVQTRCTLVDEVFQIVLMNPAVYPSASGDGKILMQYQSVAQSSNCTAVGGVNDNEYSTTGIQNADHSAGLQYCYWNVYAPSAAPLAAGRAVVYTTDQTGSLIADLTLIAPNGGEQWYGADVRDIAWHPGDVGGNISIELSRSGTGGPWEPLTASTPNDGLFSFTVTGAASSTCRVRITSLSDPLQTDVSATDFSIAGLTLSAPDGGDFWFTGDTRTISWVPAGVAGNIRVELSRTGSGGPWTVLDAGTANDGLFDWVVVSPISTACRVRITAVNDGAQTDVSAADFTIATLQTILSEGFESGAPLWTHAASGGSWVDQWHISTELAQTGTHSYKCGDPSTGTYAALNDALLLSPVLTALPANATLRYSYQIEAEVSTTFPDSAYDGGVLEVSADGGAFTQVFPTAGYNRRFRTTAGGGNPFTGPMPGLACYSATVSTWTTESLDLNPYAGQDIQLRFRFGSDAGAHREGWYVDDVSVTAPLIAPPPPTEPISVTLSRPSGGLVTLHWADDTNYGYKILYSTTPDGPWTWNPAWVTTGNSFVVPDGIAEVRRFFYVIGWDGQ